MLTVAAIALLFTTIQLALGLAVLDWLGHHDEDWHPGQPRSISCLISAFLIGLAICLVFGLGWSLVAPVDAWATGAISCLAILAVALRPRLWIQVVHRRSFMTVAGVAVGLALWEGLMASGITMIYDTALYHGHFVRWISTHPAVPGLAHLHSRLGFNSAFHVYAALVAGPVGPAYAQSLALPCLLVLPTTALGLLGFHQVFRHGASTLAGWVAAILTPVLVLGHFFINGRQSLSADHAAALVALCLAFLLVLDGRYIDVRQRHYRALRATCRWPPGTFVALAAGIGILIVFKLSMAGFLLGLGMVIFACAFGQTRRSQVLIAIPALVLAFQVARNVVLTGWLWYPIPIGSINTDWALARGAVEYERTEITNWARWSAALGDQEAFRAAMRGELDTGDFYRRYAETFGWGKIAASLLIGLALVAIGLRFALRAKRLPIQTGAALATVSCLGGICFVYLTAPDGRFAYPFKLGIVVLFVATIAHLLPRLKRPLLWLVALACMVVLTHKNNGIHRQRLQALPPDLVLPQPLPSTEYLVSGHPGLDHPHHRPQEGDQVWFAPLLTSPHPLSPGFEQRREGDLSAGFHRNPDQDPD